MFKNFIRPVPGLIVIVFLVNVTAIAKESPIDQPKKPLEIIDDLYRAFLNEKLVLARNTVRMLDDLYKTFIIQITAEYVDNPSVLPAATLSKRVFEAMTRRGWHNIRLLDATGTPFNPDNNPRDKFEREAIKAIVAGESYFERVETIDGKDYLRAATSVSAVMKDLIGAISYIIPLEE